METIETTCERCGKEESGSIVFFDCPEHGRESVVLCRQCTLAQMAPMVATLIKDMTKRVAHIANGDVRYGAEVFASLMAAIEAGAGDVLFMVDEDDMLRFAQTVTQVRNALPDVFRDMGKQDRREGYGDYEPPGYL